MDAVEDRVMMLGKVALVKCLLASIQGVCSGGIRGVTQGACRGYSVPPAAEIKGGLGGSPVSDKMRRTF